jgi:hypothetical protein
MNYMEMVRRDGMALVYAPEALRERVRAARVGGEYESGGRVKV